MTPRVADMALDTLQDLPAGARAAIAKAEGVEELLNG